MSLENMLALLISSMLVYATPLIFTSIGGVFSERSGVVNVGLEGIMVMGAFAGVVFNIEFAHSFGKATPWIAALAGGLVGLLFSLLHALATINFRADHIVSGTVLNLLAPSLAVFLLKHCITRDRQIISVNLLVNLIFQFCHIFLFWVLSSFKELV